MKTHYRLKNNANVYLVPQKDARSTTFLILYPVGSRHEEEKLRGVSHYIEHLMFKGTEKRKNTLSLTREIDRLGAEYNAFTGKEYTGYYIKVDVAYTEIALDILSDMLFHSLFDAKEMEREKTVIVEEIKMYNDNPLMNIENIFEEVLFDGCPMGQDIAGTPKHVLSYKRGDVLRYRESHYHPKNMHIVVAGAEHPNLSTLLTTYFGGAKNGKAAPVRSKSALFGGVKKEERLKIQQKKTDQLQLMLGFPAFPLSDEKRLAPLQVLNTIFGGSMSSRLFIRIRERLGLAYMIRSGMEEYTDTGYSFIRVGLDGKNLNKAIAEIQKEIEKLITKGVTARELKDAKTHIRGGLTLSLEDSSALAQWYGRLAVLGQKMVTPEEWLKQIESVTLKDVEKIAREVFVWKSVRMGVIGDVEKEAIHF